MPQLAGQFVDALRNIEPTKNDKDNAPEAHCEVSDVLAADDTLRGWGVNTLLIGSYKRHVSIRRMKDVDVLARLFDIRSDVDPATVLKEFERVLRTGFPAIDGKSRVKRQARSFQVGFPEFDGLYVDAVPARLWTRWDGGLTAWELPKRGEDGWQPTNPEELTRLSTLMNDADHFDGLYVPTVKLLRQLRRATMGKRRPGGLTIEIAAWHAFHNSGAVTGTTQTEVFVSALRATADVLTLAFVYGRGLDDPTLPGEKITARGEDADKIELANKFTSAATQAQEALNSFDSCGAAKTFRDLLGKAVDDEGDSDFVFPMPANCNLDGTAKRFTAVTAGDPYVPAGDRRFG